MVKSGQRKVRCHCGKRAEVVYLSRRGRKAREHITPTVYYENAKGEVWSGPDAVTPCPLPGYQRKEIQHFEVRAFERLMNRKMQEEHRAQIERQREASEYHERARAEARKQLDEEVLREAEGWDAQHRELLHYAMEHRDEPAFDRNFDPGFRIGAWN